MEHAPHVVGLGLLTFGCFLGLIGWLSIGRTRWAFGWRLFDAQWGDLARYGGPALACLGAVLSFVELGA